MAALPIDKLLPEITAHLRDHAAVVIQAPTGSGKTTRVPPAILAAGLAGQGRIVMLEPRRLAARAAARWMAQERSEQVGDGIGFHVRFDRQASARTRVLVVTEGILLLMLLDDPFLNNVSVLVFDEFHERSLDNDVCLGMARLLQQTVRPDLKIVVMSATLGTEAVATYLGDCPVVVGEGRLYPVTIHWRPRRNEQPLADAVGQAVEWALDQTPGDLLVFLPGVGEIKQAQRRLEPLVQQRDLLLVPLYGDLPAEQQDLALLPQAQRRIVLATNVAETSVTVEGVTAVIDSGLARILTHDPRVGLDRLQLQNVSQASAEQRAGRAGRTHPGLCIRLWSEHGHRARPEQTDPEIRRVDLAGAVLHLLCLGETDVRQFPWLEAPSPLAIDQALALLERLGALHNHKVTGLGREMARVPVQPRLGRLLIEGQSLGIASRAALAAALLGERDPFQRSSSRPEAASPSDVLDRVEALELFERKGTTSFAVGTLQRAPAKFVLWARDQLLRSIASPASLAEAGDDALLRALLAAFPDRVARRREPKGRKGVLVGGRGVVLSEASAVKEGDLFLCIDVDDRQTEALVWQASRVERDWLAPHLVNETIGVEFDEATAKVVARRRTSYLDLVLDERPAALPDDLVVARVLAKAAQARLSEVLPTPESNAGSLLLRLRCLAEWMPELAMPTLDDSALGEMVQELANRCKSLADLRSADWSSAILGRLTHRQRQALEREAPERLTVPSGSRIALRYELGRPPVLAVRMQEVFGWRDTPRVAAGRVKVLLHLLGPNYRPQQVTDDLSSFWTNTYPLIRKELRARYPKHSWPEDPLNAGAIRGVKRKK